MNNLQGVINSDQETGFSEQGAIKSGQGTWYKQHTVKAGN